MIIRYARKQDTPQVKQLWAAAFGSDEPYFSWYFSEIYRPERTLAAFMQQRMVACLQLAPYHLSLRGQPLRAAYLVGVTTAADCRRQGVGHSLLRQALAGLTNAGYKLALLYTDIPDYYAPVGFTTCYALRHVILPTVAEPLPAGWRSCAPDDASIRLLDRIYRIMCRGFDGYILRSPENWRAFLGDHLTEQGGIYLSADAYLLWSRPKDSVELREVGYTDQAALRRALAFAQRLAAGQGADRLTWLAPQAAPLLYQCGETAFPWVMARRLDLAAAAAPDEAAAKTRALLGAPDPRLWINEMT